MKKIRQYQVKIAVNIVEIVFVVFVTAGCIKGILHTCPEPPIFSRQNVKKAISPYGDVSDGKYITAADSKVWTLYEKVNDPDMVVLMEKYGIGGE